jgi:ribosomal-protein-alanine N-acetyltransferase
VTSVAILPLVPCHGDTLAAIHAVSFAEPWSTADFARFLTQPGVIGWVAGSGDAQGFILLRRAAEEAEVLTLAVDPAARRQGLARRLLDHALEDLRARGCAACFLEVAADNVAARALYAASGFAPCGRRRGYYRRANAPPGDALVLRRDL